MTAQAWAEQLASGAPIAARVVVLVAHPDDETLWLGAALARLDDAVLIHLTDGAPSDMADAHRLGLATREDYATMRAAELEKALDVLGFIGERRSYAVRDQEAVHQLEAIVARLTEDLAGAAVVITHPYEGGHPDHDTAAFAVRQAVDRLGERAPAVVEFACYQQHEGERRFARFVPHADAPEQRRVITGDEARRIDAALAAHASQTIVFGDWRPQHERWRAAPAYDFAAPPPGEASLYDAFGWSMTAAQWRALVAGSGTLVPA